LAVLVRWLPVLLLLLTSVGRGGCGGSDGGARETGAPSFRDDPWRIKRALVRSGVLIGVLVLDEIPYDPSLFFVDTGTDAGFSGRILGRYVYQLVKSGWSFASTFSGGFLPLRGGLLVGVLGMSVVEAPAS
jgi:hypothetical protein